MPKNLRQRKNLSAPLNTIRAFRNRVFHNESICWNLNRVTDIHEELLLVMGWINQDIPEWIETLDRFEEVKQSIKHRMGWI